MAGKFVQVVGRGLQFYTIWTLTVLRECPHDMVLASPTTSKQREQGISGNAVYNLVSEVHTLYIE